MTEQNSFLALLKETELWNELEKKSNNDHGYIKGVEDVCEFAAERSATIRDTFPLYTRHDEQHIFNVIKLMKNLLGDKLQDLNRDEAAMLILAACCHDIGMSCSQEKKEKLLKSEKMENYLNTHDSDYLKAYDHGGDEPVITDDIFRNFLRNIHHKQVGDVLNQTTWPSALGGKMRNDLIWVCSSHGESCSYIEKECPENDTADLRLCAVLLRLADILDFNFQRAPKAIYDYNCFEKTKEIEAIISKEEWEKNIDSRGFEFYKVSDRSVPYELPYSADCRSMQIEQTIKNYLKDVDNELTDCYKVLRKFSGRWNDLVLPKNIKQNITPIGYFSGEYRFTLDQSQVLNLLGGEELYSDPAAFVRELLQNAIDAVRTRKAFDQSLPKDWTGQINIRTWTDKDGDWFRIEDNGTGMTKEIIENHLLKVGSSYYNSDEFKKEKLLSRADDYTPISRFGIGILSCFMGDKEHSRVEISTKWYRQENKSTITPSLRLSMDGFLSGYYAMYTSEKDDNHPGEMPGYGDDEKQEYRNEPGTVVAVRTNLYRTGKYHGFKEIVDKWLVFPPVPVRYDGPDGAYDYPTQEEFMNSVRNFAYSDDLTKDGVMEFPLSKSLLDKIRQTWPEINISDSTKLVLKCVDLERYSQTPNFTGAMLAFKIEPEIRNFTVSIDEQQENLSVQTKIKLDYNKSTLELNLSIHHYEDEFLLPNLEKELTIPIELQEKKVPWYKHFQQNSIGNVAAHNGIFCGNPDFLCLPPYDNDHYNDTILLLRDGYRPEINLARNNIEQLSPELLFMCYLIRNQLANEGFSIFYDTQFSELYCCSPSDMYLSILENRPHYKESVERACKLLYKCVQIQDKKMMKLYPKGYPFSTNFTMAYLQAHYVLYLNNDLSEIILQEGKPNCQDDGWTLFPPTFFIPMENGNDTYFTRAYSWERCSCNANHPFSKFLLSNAKDIKSQSPGCFNRIVSAIANLDVDLDNDRNNLIPVLNDQLQILKSIPGNPLGVTDDLLLKESDLIYS